MDTTKLRSIRNTVFFFNDTATTKIYTLSLDDALPISTRDLASVRANATIDGEPLGPMETVGYYLIIFSAGHDTTKNALVGGMRTFLEHPDEFRKLQDHPELVESAVEEVVRWTSPVNYMKRTAAVDTVIRGQEIAKGDSVVLF